MFLIDSWEEKTALAEMMSCIPIVLRKPLEETTVHLPTFTHVKNAETEKVIVIDCSGPKQACLSPVTWIPDSLHVIFITHRSVDNPRCRLKTEVKAHEQTEKGGCKNWVKILFIYLHLHINSFNVRMDGAPQSNMLQFKYPTCLSSSPNVVLRAWIELIVASRGHMGGK